MTRIIRYLTHPQVQIDPQVPTPQWPLNEIGHARVKQICGAPALQKTQVVISSAEQKAIDTATPIATDIGCALEIWPLMHENDRSATGYLPAYEFEHVADQFFDQPDDSIRGWETAHAAQARIVSEVVRALEAHPTGDILFVGHGAVGTLLFCHLKGVPISRVFDQGPGGGGNVLTYADDQPSAVREWEPMEMLL